MRAELIVGGLGDDSATRKALRAVRYECEVLRKEKKVLERMLEDLRCKQEMVLKVAADATSQAVNSRHASEGKWQDKHDRLLAKYAQLRSKFKILGETYAFGFSFQTTNIKHTKHTN